MNLTNEQIGQRIKAVRSEKNLTQTQLAQLLGKSLRTVQSYESGESRILLDTVTTIARFRRNACISAGRKRAANQAEYPCRCGYCTL